MFNITNAAKKIITAGYGKNMKQPEFSQEMGVSYPAVNNWERGNPIPDAGKSSDLALFFYSTPLINDSYTFK